MCDTIREREFGLCKYNILRARTHYTRRQSFARCIRRIDSLEHIVYKIRGGKHAGICSCGAPREPPDGFSLFGGHIESTINCARVEHDDLV